MSDSPPPSLKPRQERLLHPGPRVRALELLLVVHVVLAFGGGFIGWMLWRDGAPWRGAGLGLLTLVPLAWDLRRFRQLARLRKLAAHGHITYGEVVGRRAARTTVAPRADGVLPRKGQPLRAILVVTYRFQDDLGGTHLGSFCTSVADRRLYRDGHRVEVFFEPTDPRRHAPSIVLRWYWRIGLAPRFVEAKDETVPFEAPLPTRPEATRDDREEH